MKTPISADLLTVAATLSRIAANPVSAFARAEAAEAARTLAEIAGEVMALEAILRPDAVVVRGPWLPGYDWTAPH